MRSSLGLLPFLARKKKVFVVRGRSGATIIGQPETGDTPAKRTTVSVGMPDCNWVTSADINDAGMIAAWQTPTPNNPNGLIELDQEHPVIRSQIEYWQAQYPVAVAKDVEKLVKDAYEEVAIAKVSHMHALTGTSSPRSRGTPCSSTLHSRRRCSALLAKTL